MADVKVQKCLMDYFTLLRSSFDNCMTIFTKCYKKTSNIYSLVERQNKIGRVNTSSMALEDLNELVHKLIFLIEKDIDKFIVELQLSCDELHKDFEALNKKMTNLDNLCDEIDFQESSTLVNGSAFQPSLSDLLEYSHDGTHFIHGAWTQVKHAIICISNRNKCDFPLLLNEFYKFDELSKQRMKEILMMTQFCNKTEL